MKKLLVLIFFVFSLQAFAFEDRVGLNLGGYNPTDNTYLKDIGLTWGVEYDAYFVENFGLGLFLDEIFFRSKEVGTTGESFILGLGVFLRFYPIINNENRTTVYIAGKLGVSRSEIRINDWDDLVDVKFKANGFAEKYFAYICEAGVRYRATDLMDFGYVAKYMHLNPEFKTTIDDIEIKTRENLSNVLFALTLGFHF